MCERNTESFQRVPRQRQGFTCDTSHYFGPGQRGSLTRFPTWHLLLQPFFLFRVKNWQGRRADSHNADRRHSIII